MPRLSVWLIRASLIHMATGFLFGSLILHHKGIPIYPWTWKLLDPHIEIMIFGWVMQFVMGIAFWILPRFSGEHRFGRVRLVWLAFFALNVGVSLAAWGNWADQNVPMLAGRLFVLAAVAAWGIAVFPRIKPLGGFRGSELSPHLSDSGR